MKDWKEKFDEIINKNLMENSAYTLLSDGLRIDLKNFILQELEARDKEWEEKIEEAMPEKLNKMPDCVEFGATRGESFDIGYETGYNQAIEDIKNNLNK